MFYITFSLLRRTLRPQNIHPSPLSFLPQSESQMTFSKTSATKNKHRLILTLFTISPSGTLSSVSGFIPFANFSIYIFALQVNSKSSKENSPLSNTTIIPLSPPRFKSQFCLHIPLQLLSKNIGYLHCKEQMKNKEKPFGDIALCLVVGISRQIDEEQENTPPAATLMYCFSS